MKTTCSLKMTTAVRVIAGIICFASTPALADNCGGVSCRCIGCDAPSSGSSGSGSSGYYYNPGPSAADIADQQARSANEQGVAAYKRGDWAAAIALFKQSLQNYPNDPTYRQNLVNAENNLANQLAREKAEREAMERQRENKVAADNMQQSIQSFAQTLNASPISGGLDFDGRTTDNMSGGNSGGLDFTAAVAAPGKSAAKSPSGDPMVVDARNVPSGLPKDVDYAIANVYASAPPGVSDRVRKGFQAVMERDWKVAKAWFQDALNRDPTNAGLKRLVALTDYSQQPDQLRATVDARNEPAALGGKRNTKKASAAAGKTKPAAAPAIDPNLPLPNPDDIKFLFPGLQAMKDKEAPVFKTLPDGKRVQMPQSSDMEFLFGPSAASSAAPARQPNPTFIIGKNGKPIIVPANSHQKSQMYTTGKDGELLMLPSEDDILLFQEKSQ